MPPKNPKKTSPRRQTTTHEEERRNLLGMNSQDQSVAQPASTIGSEQLQRVDQIQLMNDKISEQANQLIRLEEILLAMGANVEEINEGVSVISDNVENQTEFLRDFRAEVKKEFKNLIQKIRQANCNFSSWEQFWNCIGIILMAIWDFLKFIGLCMYAAHVAGVSAAGDMTFMGLPPLLFKTLFCIFEVLAYCSFIGSICLKLGLPNYGLIILKVSIDLIIYSVIVFFQCLIVIFKSLFGDAWNLLIDSLRTAGFFRQFERLYEYATSGVRDMVRREVATAVNNAVEAITPSMPTQIIPDAVLEYMPTQVVPDAVLNYMGYKGGNPSLREQSIFERGISSPQKIDTYLQKFTKTSKKTDKKVDFAKFMSECKETYESSELFKEINASQKDMMSVLDMCKELKIDSEIPSALNATVCKNTLIGILEGVEKMVDFGFCFQIGLLNIRRPVEKSAFDLAVKKTDIEQVSFRNFLKMDKGTNLSEKIDTIRLQLEKEKMQLKHASTSSKSKRKTEGGRKKKNSTRKK
jgi:hypothetical protein